LLYPLVLKNARLFQDTQDQKHRAEQLRDSATLLTRTLKVEDIYDILASQIDQLIGKTDGQTLVIINDQGTIDVDYLTGGLDTPQIREVLKLNHNINDYEFVKAFFSTPQTITIQDRHQHDNWQNFGESEDLTAFVMIPLVWGEKPLGLFVVASNTANAYNDVQIATLESFCKSLSAALHNIQLYKQSTEQGAHLQALLNGSGEGVLSTKDTTITYVNKALCSMLGYTESDLLGKSIRLLRWKDSPFNLEHIKPSSKDGASIRRDEFMLKHQKGYPLHVSMTVSQISEQGQRPIQLVAIIRDISQERAWQTAQKRFMTNSAHELRHPISNIITRLYLLRRSPEKLECHLDILETSVDRLRILAEHMALIVELDSGNFKSDALPIRLDDLFRVPLTQLAEKAQAQEVPLEVDLHVDDNQCVIDGRLAVEITRLLTQNALEYSPIGKPIKIRIVQMPKELLIMLIDCRPPLTPHGLKMFFQPFSTASEGDVVHSGLELTLASRMIHAMNGSVQVANWDQDCGIIIEVSLPLTI